MAALYAKGEGKGGAPGSRPPMKRKGGFLSDAKSFAKKHPVGTGFFAAGPLGAAVGAVYKRKTQGPGPPPKKGVLAGAYKKYVYKAGGVAGRLTPSGSKPKSTPHSMDSYYSKAGYQQKAAQKTASPSQRSVTTGTPPKASPGTGARVGKLKAASGIKKFSSKPTRIKPPSTATRKSSSQRVV